MSPLQIIGRSSSHFTRVPRLLAHELEVELELVVVYDFMSLAEEIHAGNPARKMPTLRRPDGGLVFGTENICRVIAEEAERARGQEQREMRDKREPRRIVWPEELTDDLSRNAQELVWHAMAAQVQLVVGTVIGKLPADNVYFTKGRAGFEGALAWLEAHFPTVLRTMDARHPDRLISLFEATLFCLVEHLQLRPTLPLEPYPKLVAFASVLAQRPSARATAYRMDAPPA